MAYVETRVNTTTAAYQGVPSVTALKDGGWLVTWESLNQDGSGFGVYQQRYTASGAPTGGETRVNTTTANDEGMHSVTALPDGGWIVTWHSLNKQSPSNPNGYDSVVYQQRYTAGGEPVGGEAMVATSTVPHDDLSVSEPTSVTALADGGWVVTWGTYNPYTEDVHQRRYTAAGAPAGGETRVNTSSADDQWYPSVTALTDGGWLVTWASKNQDGSGFGVYQQRYTAAGAPAGGETRVNTTTADDQLSPSVTALTDGGWLVTWASKNQDGSGFGVYQQRYTAAGAPTGGETRVNTTTADWQISPSVTALTDGGWLVTWSSNNQDGSSYGVYAQRYTAAGAPTGGETRVNTTSASDQSLSSVTGLTDGGWVVTWQSLNQDGSGFGVYQQRYEADQVVNQVVIGTGANETLLGSAGGDTLKGLGGNDTLKALGGNDWLEGGKGNDLLDGGDGSDTMLGGSGNDSYVVNDRSDRIYETTTATSSTNAGGSDTVRSSVSFTLGQFVEKLILMGSDVISGTGNKLNNTIIGNAAPNVLKGASGNDILSGRWGMDKLTGGAGKDLLTGGAQADTFVFTKDTSGITTRTADTIIDWNVADLIDMTVRGTSTNYKEGATTATSIATAAAFAEKTFTDSKIAHVFLYNAGSDTGYVLSDLDNNDKYETGVVLKGAGAASNFSYLDIL